MSEMINVEVAYALPDKQRIEKLSVAAGTTALEAVEPVSYTHLTLPTKVYV